MTPATIKIALLATSTFLLNNSQGPRNILRALTTYLALLIKIQTDFYYFLKRMKKKQKEALYCLSSSVFV